MSKEQIPFTDLEPARPLTKKELRKFEKRGKKLKRERERTEGKSYVDYFEEQKAAGRTPLKHEDWQKEQEEKRKKVKRGFLF